MAKKRVGKHSNEFRRMAVDRLNSCENIVALAKELGIQRTLVYKWRRQFEAAEAIGEVIPPNARESRLRVEWPLKPKLIWPREPQRLNGVPCFCPSVSLLRP